MPKQPVLFLAAAVTLAVAGAVAAHSGGLTMLAWYPLDDGTAADASGNGHDGVLHGQPEPAEGLESGALRFKGSSEWIEIPNDPALEVGTVAVSFLVQPSSMPRDVLLLEKARLGVGFSIRLSTAGALTFSISDGVSVHRVTAPLPLVAGRWTGVAAAYDGLSMNLYVDGEPAASRSVLGLLIANSGDVTVARYPDAGFLDGVIDDIRLATGSASPQWACGSAAKLWDAPSGTCLAKFTDVTDELDVADSFHVHFGATLVDVNDDGWIDLYYANGQNDPPLPEQPSGRCPTQTPEFPERNRNVLMLNRGDGTFEPDTAAWSGVDDPWNAMRNVWGDYDNDGRRDLFSHNFLVSPLYRAVSTDPLLFEDASAASGLEPCLRKGTGASWVDLDGDGFLDVYAVEYDPARPAAEHVNKLYLNNGDGTFRDVTAAAGLGGVDNPMGVSFADYDNDGDQDVFVTNSHEAPSRLYQLERVTPSGVPRFVDVGPEAGVDVVGEAGLGFAAAWGDYNNDGRLDLFFARTTDSRLYRNDGPDSGGVWRFTDVTGVGGMALSGDYKDAAFADLDNDGWLDLVLAAAGPNAIFLNNGDETWREVAPTLGMAVVAFDQLGGVPGDIDNDGDLDVVLVSRPGQNFLFENRSYGNNWLQVRLTGTVSNRDAVGARVYVTTVDGGGEELTQMREVIAGTGFFSDTPRIQTIGLGTAPIAQVSVRWPTGAIEDLGVVAVNQRIDVVE